MNWHQNTYDYLCHRFLSMAFTIFACISLANCGLEYNLKKGEEHLALGEYYDAAKQFKQAYLKTPVKERENRGKRALKMAICYDKINATPKAISAYANAIRYKQTSLNDKINYARLLLKNGQYKMAEKEFLELKDSLPENILVTNGLISAQKAPLWKKQGSRYKVKRMDIFNSRRDDYSPMLYGDHHDQLFFTSTRNESLGDDLSSITGTKTGDIYVSLKDDKGRWSRPEVLNSGVNTTFDEGACCFSADGREMYLTQCSTDPQNPRYAQIVVSQRSDATWGKGAVVELTRDTLSSYAHPAISPDGKWLYFTSDMPGGLGGLDIWRARITPTGLGGVENLGTPINTPGDEEFPTFRPNGELYFSSNGHPGMGGLDIYIAKTDPQTHKYHISHPGYPLNSEGDDFGMTFEGTLNQGFFCSNRKDGRGYDHIYSFNNPEIIQTIKGWVYETDGYELPAAEVYLISNNGLNKKVSVLSDGSFNITVEPGVSYLMMATCKGFLNHKEEITIPKVEESQEYTLQFPLASISAPVLIENIFYEFDKATLTSQSQKALDQLVNLLNENPHVTIELRSHCDYKGTREYNKKLSQLRAEAVVNYLIRHGIAKDRLTAVGYGKEKPKVIRKKLTEKYPWLKENDVLTEEFIRNQSKEKQDICNQLNRRTEFVVLRTTYNLFDSKGHLKHSPSGQKKNAQSDEDFNVHFE